MTTFWNIGDRRRAIGAQAGAGEIYVSDKWCANLSPGRGFRFTDCGETTLRGFDEPMRLHLRCAGEDVPRES